MDFQVKVEHCIKMRCNVLIQGETGSGKDYLASYIHRNSSQSSSPFVAINCAAIPEQLFESELFGHEQGAFTGAVQRKLGLVESARGGTLFLNEVGLLPILSQAKILSYLDEGAFIRVGASVSTIAKARIISASNTPLIDLVSVGLFRMDLYYRLAAMVIDIPPLRKRDDFKELICTIFADTASSAGCPDTLPSNDVLNILMSYHYPGNVRQLRNIIEIAIDLSKGGEVLPCHVHFPSLDVTSKEDMCFNELKTEIKVSTDQNLKTALNKARDELIVKALNQTKGNVTQAAKLLGISRDSLKYFIHNA